jgi:hypothetical protein
MEHNARRSKPHSISREDVDDIARNQILRVYLGRTSAAVGRA